MPGSSITDKEEELEQEEDISSNNSNRRANTVSTRVQQEYEEKRKQRVKDETFRKHQIEYRRNTVFTLSSQGLNQYEIAKVLRVSQSLVCLDLNYLRNQFKEALKHHIEAELPLIYNQAMHGIAQVIQHAYAIHNTPGVPEQIKLHALSLIADCQERRMDLASSGEIIQQGISYVERMHANVNNLVRAIPDDQVREILHEDNIIEENDESSRMDESSGGAAGGGIDDDTEISKGINNSASPTQPAATSSTNSNTFEEVEDQSNEDLSLTDPDNNTTNSHHSSTTTSPTAATSDVDDPDEAPTTNTIF